MGNAPSHGRRFKQGAYLPIDEGSFHSRHDDVDTNDDNDNDNDNDNDAKGAIKSQHLEVATAKGISDKHQCQDPQLNTTLDESVSCCSDDWNDNVEAYAPVSDLIDDTLGNTKQQRSKEQYSDGRSETTEQEARTRMPSQPPQPPQPPERRAGRRLFSEGSHSNGEMMTAPSSSKDDPACDGVVKSQAVPNSDVPASAATAAASPKPRPRIGLRDVVRAAKTSRWRYHWDVTTTDEASSDEDSSGSSSSDDSALRKKKAIIYAIPPSIVKRERHFLDSSSSSSESDCSSLSSWSGATKDPNQELYDLIRLSLIFAAKINVPEEVVREVLAKKSEERLSSESDDMSGPSQEDVKDDPFIDFLTEQSTWPIESDSSQDSQHSDEASIHSSLSYTGSDGQTYYPLEALQNKAVPHVDVAKREEFLSPKVFCAIFGMTKEEFYKLAKWKRDMAKRDARLF